jgi:hypothetical protein
LPASPQRIVNRQEPRRIQNIYSQNHTSNETMKTAKQLMQDYISNIQKIFNYDILVARK